MHRAILHLIVRSAALAALVAAVAIPCAAAESLSYHTPWGSAPDVRAAAQAEGVAAQTASPGAGEGSAGSLRFAPLGVTLLAGTATLSGTLIDATYGYPMSGVTVTWYVPDGEGWASGSAVSDTAGSFTLTNVPGAAGTGELWLTRGDTPYMVGRTGMTWPDGSATSSDVTTCVLPLHAQTGGPWGENQDVMVAAYGHEGPADLYYQDVFDYYPILAYDVVRPAAGFYDWAAVYFWANEGVEIKTDTRVLPQYGYVWEISFADGLHGWLACDKAILRTTDGGASWASYPVDYGAAHTVAFTDAQNGLAVGSQILWTTDGGLTWGARGGSIPFSSSESDIALVDGQRAWIVGSKGYPLSGGFVEATNDGGQTWTEQTAEGMGELHGVAFADAQHGWAVSEGGDIWATTDGATWTKQYTASATRLNRVEVLDAQHLVAVGAGGTIVATSDGGASWQAQTSGTTAELRDVAFADVAHGWAVGQGVILGTTDGGATWLPQTDVTGTSGLTVGCTDASHAWVGANFTFLETSDGGATWSRRGGYAYEQTAQRAWIQSPIWASGAPGTTVKLNLQNYPAAQVSAIGGYPSYPANAALHALRSYTSKGAKSELVSVKVPSTARPGYHYILRVAHDGGVLMLDVPFQTCTLKPSRTAVAKGGTVRLSGVIPTKGHLGSTRGISKKVTLYMRTTAAGQPKAADARYVGWTKVGTYQADGLGRFTTALLKPARTTWYVLRYPKDSWYWGAYTNVVKVKVY